eukprot:2987946-Amphidinium_carterae.2
MLWRDVTILASHGRKPAVAPDLPKFLVGAIVIAVKNSFGRVHLHVDVCQSTKDLPVAVSEVVSRVRSTGHQDHDIHILTHLDLPPSGELSQEKHARGPQHVHSLEACHK